MAPISRPEVRPLNPEKQARFVMVCAPIRLYDVKFYSCRKRCLCPRDLDTVRRLTTSLVPVRLSSFKANSHQRMQRTMISLLVCTALAAAKVVDFEVDGGPLCMNHPCINKHPYYCRCGNATQTTLVNELRIEISLLLLSLNNV